MIHRGRCHCGAVVLEVEAPEDIEAYECNCSMYERVGYRNCEAAADLGHLSSP
jgi:hypothetical protein